MPNYKSKIACGQGLIEYGLIIALVATGSILALAATGNSIEGVYCSAIEGLGGDGCGFTPENWLIERGDWTIGDEICGKGGEGRIYADGFTGEDYIINIESARLFQGNGYGVYFRTSQPHLVDGYTFQYDPGYKALIFRKWVGGHELSPPIAVERMPSDYDWYSTDHQIQLSVIGDTFIVNIDGQEMMKASDNTYTKGGLGLRTWDNTIACFDGIKVTNP
jgi:Flp pilus assembly pilin Flp